MHGWEYLFYGAWSLSVLSRHLIGSHIGGNMAVNKGDTFIMRVMVVLIFVSAIGLIAGA